MRCMLKQLTLLGLATLLASCGGGGANNDQGVSFSLIQFNGTNEDGVCDPNIGLSQEFLFLSDGNAAESPPEFGSFSCVTVQNNMTTQAVRVDRMFVEYYVPGADMQPPSTTYAWGKVLGATQINGVGVIGGNNQQGGGQQGGGQQGGGGGGNNQQGGGQQGGQQGGAIFSPIGLPGSSLPPVFAAPTSYTSGFMLATPEVREWFSLNRNKLPEPPFVMTGIFTASGVTSSGDRIETNSLELPISVLEDRLISPPSPVEAATEAAAQAAELGAQPEIEPTIFE